MRFALNSSAQTFMILVSFSEIFTASWCPYVGLAREQSVSRVHRTRVASRNRRFRTGQPRPPPGNQVSGNPEGVEQERDGCDVYGICRVGGAARSGVRGGLGKRIFNAI